jgi:peptide/nickel transport system permease protein
MGSSIRESDTTSRAVEDVATEAATSRAAGRVNVAPPRNTLRATWIRFSRRKINVAALVFLAFLVCVAIFAPQLAPHDPLGIDHLSILVPPSGTHWFGTDPLGRDILSRLVYGSRITVSIGVISMAIATTTGVLLGVTAGFLGGWVDSVIMRLTDILLAIPYILLALSIIAILGPDINNVIIAVGIAAVPQFVRVTRGSTLSVREDEYVTAARALGQTDPRILFRHVLPNIIAPIVVLSTLRVAAAVISAAALSFVGLGAQPPSPEWGAMLSDARAYMQEAWWFTAFPGMAIALTVLAVNVIGDALRDILDPKAKY